MVQAGPDCQQVLRKYLLGACLIVILVIVIDRDGSR